MQDDDTQNFDDYEREVLVRARRVGWIWMGMGFGGLALTGGGFLLGIGGMGRHFIGGLLALAAVSLGAIGSGWNSATSATESIRVLTRK